MSLIHINVPLLKSQFRSLDRRESMAPVDSDSAEREFSSEERPKERESFLSAPRTGRLPLAYENGCIKSTFPITNLIEKLF